MFEIIVTEEIKKICPVFEVVALYAKVKNSEHCSDLWQEIHQTSENLKANYNADEIKNIKTIAATREIYKLCGKDPSRYRPAAEALCRRIIKGNELYQIDTLVDLINLLSIYTGYSIGGFDASKIKGKTLHLGIGKANEPYEGIGRGFINIEGLPVYRDDIGGIGTPTSDNERTKIDIDTKELLVLINGYSGNSGLSEAVDMLKELITKYADAKDIEVKYYK